MMVLSDKVLVVCLVSIGEGKEFMGDLMKIIMVMLDKGMVML